MYGGHQVGEWAHNLAFHSAQVQGKFGFKEALDDFTRGLGWIIGFNGVEANQGPLVETMRTNFLPFGMSAGSFL